MQVCFLDHYDSFSFNLIDWLFSDTGLELVYSPYDTPQLFEKLREKPMPLVLSPGPKDPHALPATMRILEEQLGKVPIFGICLGHQCLGLVLGGTIGRAKNPFHGSTQTLKVAEHSKLLRDLPEAVRVARYNSLVVQNVPSAWVTAWNEDLEIEAIEYYEEKQAAISVQFHPESFLTVGVDSMKEVWIKLVSDYYRSPAC